MKLNIRSTLFYLLSVFEFKASEPELESGSLFRTRPEPEVSIKVDIN